MNAIEFDNLLWGHAEFRQVFLEAASPRNEWERGFLDSISKFTGALSDKRVGVMKRMILAGRKAKDLSAAFAERDAAHVALDDLNRLAEEGPENLYCDGERPAHVVRQMFQDAEDRLARAEKRLEDLGAYGAG